MATSKANPPKRGESNRGTSEPTPSTRPGSGRPSGNQVPWWRIVPTQPEKQTGGRPLDSELRRDLEPNMGVDLGRVRVHTDDDAAASVHALGARAYTAGRDVFFGRGEYAPQTRAGRRLIAHELTHVAQGSTSPAASPAREVSTPADPAERQADQVADVLADGGAYTGGFVAPSAAIHRAPGPDDVPPPNPNPLGSPTVSTQGDVIMRMWADDGLFSLTLVSIDPNNGARLELPWVAVSWKGKEGGIDITLGEEKGKNGYQVALRGHADLRVTVSFNAEAAYAAKKMGPSEFKHAYFGNGHKLRINTHLPPGWHVDDGVDPSKAVETEEFTASNGYFGMQYDREMRRWEPAPSLPGPPGAGHEEQNFWWEFDTYLQLDHMAAAHPQWYWISYRPQREGERLRARHFSEEQLQDEADAFRRDRGYSQTLTRIYENGRQWDDVQRLGKLFYRYPWIAEGGMTGDAPECIIFKHASKSFGRWGIAHDQALVTWQLLEGIHEREGRGGVYKWVPNFNDYQVPGTFFELVAKGRSGIPRRIDEDYWPYREKFRANVEALRKDQGSSWEDLNKDGNLWLRYLEKSLDRDESDMDAYVREAVDNVFSDFVSTFGAKVLMEAEDVAYGVACGIFDGYLKGLAIYQDPEQRQALLLQFPTLGDSDRRDALSFLGVPYNQHSVYLKELSDPGRCIAFVLGAETNASIEVDKSTWERVRDVFTVPGVAQYPGIAGQLLSSKKQVGVQVSLNDLVRFIDTQAKDTQKGLDQIHSGKVGCLDLPGDLGVKVRKVTYEKMGFKLDPESYPHEDVDMGKWTTDTLRTGQATRDRPWGSPAKYGNELGYLYARATNSREQRRFWTKVLLVALAVIVAVVLVLVAAYIAVGLVAFLGFAETVAGTVIEILVTATIVTAAGPGLNTFILSGGTATWEDYQRAYSHIGRDFIINVITFGIFKALTAGVEAAMMARAGVTSMEAMTPAWRTATALANMFTTGTAMWVISNVQYLVENGKLPDKAEAGWIAYETVLSIVALEVGGRLARPSMEAMLKNINLSRLAEFSERITSLRQDVRKLALETGDYASSPLAAGEKGEAILKAQEEILQAKAKLLEDMRGNWRNKNDAAKLDKLVEEELAQIRADVEIINQVRILQAAEVKPYRFEGDTAEFTYKRGQEQKIKDVYGEKNVIDVGDGVYEVTRPDGTKMRFRPATDVEAGFLPDGSRRPEALEAWQGSAVSRQKKILERARNTGAGDDVFAEVAKAEPRSMSREEMAKFEKTLAKAEARLDKLEAKGAGAGADQKLDRSGDSVDAWRQRLGNELIRLRNRARMLGLEGDYKISELENLRTDLGKDFTDADLAEHQRIMEEARKFLDDAYAQRMKAIEAGEPAKPADLDAIKARLEQRRADVKRLAKKYGASGTKYVKEATRPLGNIEKPSTLAEREAAIAKAEARLDALAKKFLEPAEALFGADLIKAARSSPGLEKLTDAQVGEVMRQLLKAGVKKLSVDALRGALFAYYTPKGVEPIALDKLAARAKDDPGAFEFVLETFARLRDFNVQNADGVLRDAAGSGKKWRGAIWVLERVVYKYGASNIEGFEVRVWTDSGGREIDIKLKSGETIECKDWPPGQWRPEKVDEQFYKDLERETGNGANPDGMKNIRWDFRSPTPVDVAEIRAQMRQTLERFIKEKTELGLTADQANELRAAFDAADELLNVGDIDRKQVVTPKVTLPQQPVLPPRLPPPPQDDDNSP